MSSDIKERLRVYGWHLVDDDGESRESATPYEAADRIEALEGERDRFLAGGLEADNRTLRATRRAEAAEQRSCDLEAEVARLREALTNIQLMTYCDASGDRCVNCIARKAILAAAGEEGK
jgi:hypothetical protein